MHLYYPEKTKVFNNKFKVFKLFGEVKTDIQLFSDLKKMGIQGMIVSWEISNKERLTWIHFCNLKPDESSKKANSHPMKNNFLLPLSFLLFVFSIQVTVFCEKNSIRNASNPEYRILIPSEKIKNNLQVLKPLPPDDPRYSKANYLFENTFISESVRLYR